MKDATEKIREVTVVGGGHVGLLSALCLKRRTPSLEVRVIDDLDEPIPDVGKSTYNLLLKFLHDILRIDPNRFVKQVRPVWKSSVHFKDWCGVDPFHFPFDNQLEVPQSLEKNDQFQGYYHQYQTGNFSTIGSEMVEQEKTPYYWSDGELHVYRGTAYHLNLKRFTTFLRTLCRERGIELVNDRVTRVRTKPTQSWITGLEGDTGSYTADLYIDATGFSRVLVSELPVEFESFNLPLDSAVVGKADIEMSDVTPATVIRSGEAGWFWQIDTTDSRDLGYVYSSSHASQETATKEFLENFKEETGLRERDLVHHTFTSGALTQTWCGNCVAVGNAEGFIEPLESTALTQAAWMMKTLADFLFENSWYPSPGLREAYNRLAESRWENLYQFIAAHYAFAPGETLFWKDIREQLELEQTYVYQYYRENGLGLFELGQMTNSDFRPGPVEFPQSAFNTIFRHLNVQSPFYDQLSLSVQPHIKERFNEFREMNQRHVTENHLTHEEVYDNLHRIDHSRLDEANT